MRRNAAQPLLVLLLALPLDVELLLLTPEIRSAFPLELVPGDRELVLDGPMLPGNAMERPRKPLKDFLFQSSRWAMRAVRPLALRAWALGLATTHTATPLER